MFAYNHETASGTDGSVLASSTASARAPFGEAARAIAAWSFQRNDVRICFPRTVPIPRMMKEERATKTIIRSNDDVSQVESHARRDNTLVHLLATSGTLMRGSILFSLAK